jgi:hypothetical protein
VPPIAHLWAWPSTYSARAARDGPVRYLGKAVYARCEPTSGWLMVAVDLGGTPPVDDLEFEVKPGSGTGEVRLDDVTVTRACSFTCWRSHFQSMASTEWSLTSNSPGTLKPWAALPSPTPAPSGDAVVATAGFDLAKTPSLVNGALTFAAWRAAMVVPVAGASWTFTTDVQSSPACKPALPAMQFWLGPGFLPTPGASRAATGALRNRGLGVLAGPGAAAVSGPRGKRDPDTHALRRHSERRRAGGRRRHLVPLTLRGLRTARPPHR